MSVRESLKKVLVDRCVQRGKFKLATGRTSEYYLDVKRAALDPEAGSLIVHSVLEELRRRKVHALAIGGLESGATSITGAVVAMSHMLDWCSPIAGFFVRKEPKTHGLRKKIEGFQGSAGSPVVVVDDVCTSGGSVLQAIRQVESKGYVVSAVLSVVDREEGAAETLSNYRYFSLFRASELT